MFRKSRLKSVQFASGSIVALAISSPALAECNPDPTPEFETVTCSDDDADGLVVNTNGTTVDILEDATVSSILATTNVTAAEPFNNFNFITINANGLVSNGLVVDSGKMEAGVFNSPGTTVSLTVGEAGSIGGATAILLRNDPATTFGNAIIDIDNAGVIESASGPAILATNAERQGIGRLVNQATGRMGAIHAVIGSLDNQGVIDGDNISAIRYFSPGFPAIFASGGVNSGDILSNSTAATIDVQSPNIFSFSLTNSGTIENAGAGNALNLDVSSSNLTNEASGIINAANGVAISATNNINILNDGEISGAAGAISVAGQLFLTNRGTIDGDVVVSDGPFSSGSVIDLSGGMLNGSLTLGSGDDFVTTEFVDAGDLFGGIAGTIDPGAGNNTLQVNFGSDTTLTEALLAPSAFQILNLGIVGGSTLILDQGFTTASAINLVGESFPPENVNNFINRADISSSGTALFLGPATSALTITNEGSITATLVNDFDYAVNLGQVNAFANSGTITANVGRAVRIGSGATIPVINDGSVIADDIAFEIFGATLTNRGIIISNNAVGLTLSGSFGTTGSNSGTISGRTAGLRLSTGPFTNSGTISGSVGPGVELSFNGILENAAGGMISGGSAAIGPDSLFGYSRGATVRNAGTIDGNVDFGFLSFGGSTFFSNNRFIVEDGGIVNGDLHLGSGGDTLVTRLVNNGPGEFAGVTGTVTGGPNSILSYIVDQDIETSLNVPGFFSNVAYDLSNDALLTLSGQANSNSTRFVGSGRVEVTSDLSSFSDDSTVTDATILSIGVGESAQTTGDPAVPVPNILAVTSRGTLTRTDNRMFGTSGPTVQVFSNSRFTNEGSIVVNDLILGGSRLVGIAGTSGTVINNGTISVGGASAIHGGLFFSSDQMMIVTNNGAIDQLDGAFDGIGVANVSLLTNNGSITTNGTAVQIGSDNSSIGGTVVNAGLIESFNEIAIRTADDPRQVVPSMVTNLANGIITSGLGQLAIGLIGGASVENAGTINGDVDLAFGDNFDFRGSSFFSNGGILNGDLIFGNDDDTFISVGDTLGVTGTIDAGEGFDTFVQGFTSSTTTQAAASRPDSFESFGIAAIGSDVTVEVDGPAGGLNAPLTFLGSGTIINRTDIVYSAAPNSFLTPPNRVTLGSRTQSPLGEGGLAFINEASLFDGVDGTARQFVNRDVIGTEDNLFPAVGLIAAKSDTFSFENSGTISTSADNPAVFQPRAVFINPQFNTPSLDTATFDNSGDIIGAVDGSFLTSNFSFTNSGSITAAENSAIFPSIFQDPAVFISVREAQLFPNPGTSVSESASFENSGLIDGLNANISVNQLTFNNSGEFSSDVQIQQFSIAGGVFENTRAIISNSGDIAGNGDGTAVVLGLSTQSKLVEFLNSGSIVAPLQPDQFTFRNNVLSLNNSTAGDQQIMVDNSGTITSESRAGTAAFVTAIGDRSLAFGLPEPLPPAAASIDFENSGSILANGGGAINQFSFFNGVEFQTVNQLINAAGISAFAAADAESTVQIINTATGTIESSGNLRFGNTPDGTDRSEVPATPAGFGSTAIIAYGDTVTINNSGSIIGGLGGNISEAYSFFIDVGEPIDLATLFPDNFLAGAIQTLVSTDNVRNESGGVITGSIDLGAFDDILENRGLIDGNIFLRDGDDQFFTIAGMFNGIADGGAGVDSLVVDITGVSGEAIDLGAFVNFESGTFSGDGSVNLSGIASFETINLSGGTINVLAGESLSAAGPVALTGSSANETLINAGTVSGDVVLGAGDDLLTNTGNINGNVSLGDGNDNLSNDGMINGDVALGLGDDQVTNAGTITGNLDLGSGNNELANSGMVTGNVGFGDEADIADNQGTISGNVELGGGENMLTNDGTIGGNVAAGSGNDTLTNTGMINGTINLGDGNDMITNDGILMGDIMLGRGDDRLIQGITGVSMGIVDGGIGMDLLSVDTTGAMGAMFDFSRFINFETVGISGSGSVELSGDLEFETIFLDGGTIIVAEGNRLSTTGPVAITGGSGDETVVNGGTIAGDLQLGGGNDSLTNAGNVIGNVDLGDGNNEIANAVGGLLGGFVTFGSGADKFTNNGTVSGAVSLGGGNDMVSNFGTLSADIRLGDGDDMFANAGHVVGSTDLGDGTNTVSNAAGGELNGGLSAGTGADQLTNSGIVRGDINLGGGMNILTNQASGAIFGMLNFGAGDDGVTNSGNITGPINLGDGNNRLVNAQNGVIEGDISFGENQNELSNFGNISGNITFGTGNNNVINNGVLAGSVNLGIGSNTVNNGAGGTIQNGITGVAGSDILSNSGQLLGSSNFGDGANTVNNEATGLINGTLIFGDGNDTIINNGQIGAAPASAAASDIAGPDKTTVTATVAEASETKIQVAVTPDSPVAKAPVRGNLQPGLRSNIGIVDQQMTLAKAADTPANNAPAIAPAVMNALGTMDIDIKSTIGTLGDQDDSTASITGPENSNLMSIVGNIANSPVNAISNATQNPADGVYLGGGDDRLVNMGLISVSVDMGDGSDMVANSADGRIEGTLLLGSGNDQLTNAGLISGMIDLGSGANIVTNSGTLSGQLLGGNDVDVITNSGLISGNVSLADGADTLTNTGVIDGDILLGGGNDAVNNQGTLSGSLDMGAGDDIFIFNVGSKMTGNIDGGDGTDSFLLAFTDQSVMLDKDNISNITGFEELVQQGGEITLATNLSGFDAINLNSGQFVGLAGSTIDARTILVTEGATFGSAGNVNANITINGTLTPGASPGTMSVAGNVQFGSNSISIFELSPTVNDQLVVTGSVTVADGATLNLVGTRPITPGLPLNLVSASDGISGAFTVIKDPGVFGFIRQQGNAIQLLGLFPVGAGLNPQIAATVEYTNTVLQANEADNALLNALPGLVTAAGATNSAAFAQLNPEAFASAGQIGIENGLAITKTLRNASIRPASDNNGAYTFARGFGNWRRLPGDALQGTSRGNIRNTGVLGGIGYGSAEMSVAAFVGYIDSEQKISGLGATNEADGIIAGATGNISSDGFHASATIVYDGSSVDTRRLVPGNNTIASNYNLKGWSFDLTAAYSIKASNNWTAEPKIGLTHVSTRRGLVNETSGSAFDLDVARRKYEATFIDGVFTLRGGQKEGSAFRPWISAGIRHQLNDSTTLANAAFTGATTQFTVQGLERRRTLATFGAGAAADIGKSTTFFIGYNGEFGSGGSGNQVTSGVRVKF